MIHIYTDGSRMMNNGLCGIAWKIIYEDGSTQISAKHVGKADNNEAELLAIIDALKIVPNKPITLYTDSRYCLNILATPAVIRKKNKYKHKELINELEIIVEKFTIFKQQHIKAHAHNPHNIDVDKHAKMAAKDSNYFLNTILPYGSNRYHYERKELVEFTKEYIETMDGEKLARILSQIYCAKFEFDESSNSFSGTVDLIKD